MVTGKGIIILSSLAWPEKNKRSGHARLYIVYGQTILSTVVWSDFSLGEVEASVSLYVNW